MVLPVRLVPLCVMWVFGVCVLTACPSSKSDDPVPLPTSPSAATVTSATQAVPTPAVASSDAAAPVPAANVRPDAGAGTGAPTCGKKPLPECPLQGWMNARAKPAGQHGNAGELGAVFEASAKLAPPGYTNWASVANDGAHAARAGKIDEARAACRSCHEQYKLKYRTEMRDRALPSDLR